MTSDIQGSVGHQGVNHVDDVKKVQQRLSSLSYKIGSIDGICGRRTIAGILAFQGSFLKFPDGRIDPGGRSWRRLRDLTDTIILKNDSVIIKEASTDYTKLVAKPASSSINVGLSSPGNDFLIKKFGKPRESFSQDDQPITNKKLLALMKTESVGPFRVYGLGEAIDSMKMVFEEISKNLPVLYNQIGNAGMTVCRYQRGSTTKISNHSWGTAIDLKVGGLLDQRGDGMTQAGLFAIAPFFNKYGWYWGASFPIEDSMHFECSQSLLETFKA